jgi:hypothetical protein
MSKDNDNLIEKLRGIFVTIEIFNLRLTPVEKLVYGMVSLIVTSVLLAVIYLVIKR